LESHLTTNYPGKAKTSAAEPLYSGALKSKSEYHAAES